MKSTWMRLLAVALALLMLVGQRGVLADTPDGVVVTSTPTVNVTSGGGGASTFAQLRSGTNTTAAMVVGTGGSLAATGTGTIAATSTSGTVTAAGLNLAPRALTFASSPYTVVATDTVLTCNATGGAVTITLPAATGSGRTLFVKKTDATTNACTLTRSAADTIDGSTSVSYTALNASQLISDTAAGIWVRLHTVAMGGSLGGTSNAATITNGTGSISFAGATAARVMTTPDASFTVARTDAANTFTGHQTIEGVATTGATGTNLLVFGTSPTLVTPTIASFTNATHNHQDAAGGGTLTGAALPPVVSAKTGATYTTTAADIAATTTITNSGNAGTLAITLMNDPTAGLSHRICEVDAQTITVAPSAGETMYFGGTTASLLTSGAISACIVVTAVTGGSGAKWFASSSGGPVS